MSNMIHNRPAPSDPFKKLKFYFSKWISSDFSVNPSGPENHVKFD